LSATDQSTFGIGSGYSKYTLFSLLGRINYSYKDKYLLTLTARNDESSRFAENHKQAFFPALAFGWRLTEEPFIKNLNVFDNLKLRSSFGFNGNQGITPYGSLPRLANTGGYLLGGQKIVGYYASQLSNPNLKWETTRQFDLGLEAGILKGRINIELDYYSKRTKDLLLDLQLPTQTGFTSKLTNIGAISNKGLELSINTVNIKSENFTWETSLNISGNRNKVLDLAGIDNISVNQIYFGGNSSISALQVGQPVGTFWGATYYGTLKSLTSIPKGAVDPNSTHKLGDALYVDKDGDGTFGTGDFGVIGNSNPKYFGGIGNTFTYKKISLSAYLEGSYGNQVMNIGDAFYNTGDPLTNQFAAIANRWTPSNPNSDIPRVNSRQYIPSNRWVYNGSFLRLKSLNVGYTFSGRDLHASWFKSLYVYVTGTNLFLITKYPYYDPETNAYSPTDPNSGSTILRGFDNTNYPQNRTYAIGVNFTL
jgi:TonB-linked SusC/RagA family outer membrane protein